MPERKDVRMDYSGKLRRSIFGGFKRKDVLNCIEELNNSYTDTTAQLEARASAAEEANAKNAEELSRCQEELSQLREQHQTTLAQCAEQTEKNGALTAENESLRAQVSATISVNDAKIKEIGALKEENRQLRFKAESLEIKGKKYDQFTAEFSDMLLQSRQQSEQVLAEAKSQAEDIVRSASQRAELLAAEKKQQVAAMDEQITGFELEVRRMKQNIEAIAAGAQNQLDQLEKMIGRSRITLNGTAEQPREERKVPPAGEFFR